MVAVKEIMDKKVISAKSDYSLKKICQILIKNKISGVPIVNNKKEIVGFISERDIIAAVPKQNFYTKKAEDIMTKNVITVEASRSFNDVSLIFSNEEYRQIPVVSNGKLVGIISRKEVIDQMLGHYY